MGEAIAKQEGFYLRKSLAKRNNNPGNLRSWGKNPIQNGFACFKTPQEGFDALHKQILLNINKRLTFLEFFAGQRDDHGEVIKGGYPGYAPSKDANNPLLYAKIVTQSLLSNGVIFPKEKDPIHTIIKDLIT